MARKGENILLDEDGRWEARYVKGYHLNGKCIYGYIYGKSYQEVKNKRIQLLMDPNYIKANNKKQDNIPIRFNDKINDWLARQKITVKMSTYYFYYNTVSKHIIPELGEILISNINDNLITQFITNKIEDNKLQMSTIKEITIVLKQILSFCGLNIKVALPKVPKSRISVLSKEEMLVLQNYISSNLNEYSIGVLLSLYAGLRIGEVCALKWENIDLENGIISIEKTVSRVKNDDTSTQYKTKLILLESKTVNSIRQIPLNNNLIKKKLKYLSIHDKVQYNRSLASYYGYFLGVFKTKKLNFKMKLIDKYNAYKDKYKNALVIMKEGIFYKTFNDDAKILWYLFDYKYVNDTVSFGNVPYDKVILKLNKLDISYIIIDNDNIVLSYLRDEETFLSYKSLAKKSYNKTEKTEELVDKLKLIMTNSPDNYEKINTLFDKLLEE